MQWYAQNKHNKLTAVQSKCRMNM